MVEQPEFENEGTQKSEETGFKALIVEDEAIVAEDLRMKMLELGFTVVAVTGSGREAIELARSTPPDVVLMDFQIRSDLNGPETAVVIQGLTETPVPIVFLTAHAESEFPLVHAVAPYVYLRKPFSGADLKRTLEQALYAKS